ncbi:unnamed protein product [Trifolium pratense]|uniref:Uncharacterized protein n=1 Tax=Trifolium pratense TaxID=57577 RepID=A0ACB0M3L5_TRIPR|nr:unnamed protein product [Trifolium pratense]
MDWTVVFGPASNEMNGRERKFKLLAKRSKNFQILPARICADCGSSTRNCPICLRQGIQCTSSYSKHRGNFWDVCCIAHNSRLLHLVGAINGYQNTTSIWLNVDTMWYSCNFFFFNGIHANLFNCGF